MRSSRALLLQLCSPPCCPGLCCCCVCSGGTSEGQVKVTVGGGDASTGKKVIEEVNFEKIDLVESMSILNVRGACFGREEKAGESNICHLACNVRFPPCPAFSMEQGLAAV